MARRPKLTTKQKLFVKEVRRRAPDGLPTQQDLAVAALKAYDIKPTEGHDVASIASTIAGQNLQKPDIRKALGLDDIKEEFWATMYHAFKGTHPTHPGSIELLRDAMKLAGRGLIASEANVHVDDATLETRSDQELKFFAEHGKWPEDLPSAGNA